MGVKSLRIFRYRLQLVSPLVLPGRTLLHREGLLLGAPDDPVSCWGDASPLPGWSTESLDEVIQAARAGAWDRYPSLSFAHRCVLDAATVPDDDKHPGWSVPVNGLLQGSRASQLQQAQQARELGFPTIKVKVGRSAEIMEEVRLLREIQDRLAPFQQLRLDANRAWTFTTAVRFAEAVRAQDLSIEYIEEPTRNPRDLEAWHRATGLPYALDETLREPIDLEEFPHANALVLKPTLMTHSAMERAMRANRRLVFSACYESGVGILQLARLAARLSDGVAAGLDTYRWLGEDVVDPHLRFEAGQLHVPGQSRIRLESCEEVGP